MPHGARPQRMRAAPYFFFLCCPNRPVVRARKGAEAHLGEIEHVVNGSLERGDVIVPPAPVGRPNPTEGRHVVAVHKA
jgi:hypothetical protein